MKKAINQYHIQMRKDYSGKRAERVEEEVQKRKEAARLVKQCQNNLDSIINRERNRIQRLVAQKAEAYRDANQSLNTLRRQGLLVNSRSNERSLDRSPQKQVFSSSILSRNPQGIAKQYKSNLVPSKLNWKPKIPLYVELEQNFNDRQSL